jgi:glycosyltransferase involved in cell wall biosynthesis|tara:strand:- start:711 stop:1493 length:783 start_codon:yes stop_codon:yes gene_type:complete
MSLPFFSIVTPVKNGEKYIESTIKSVLDQNFKNFEYIIVDGDSKDRTNFIISKYKKKITRIISKKDKSMYSAIKTGFEFANGKYFLWINSDDVLANKNTLQSAYDYLNKHKTPWITGRVSFMYKDSTKVKSYIPLYYPRFIINKGYAHKCMWGFIQQESTIFSKKLYKKVGGIKVKYKVAGDFFLWKNFSKVCKLESVDIAIGVQRKWEGQMQKNLSLYYQEIKKRKCKFNIFYIVRILVSILYYIKLKIIKTNVQIKDI